MSPIVIIIKPINSLVEITCPNTREFRIIDAGGIIIVQISKLPAPVFSRILKYKKYATTEHNRANITE